MEYTPFNFCSSLILLFIIIYNIKIDFFLQNLKQIYKYTEVLINYLKHHYEHSKTSTIISNK